MKEIHAEMGNLDLEQKEEFEDEYEEILDLMQSKLN